MGSVSRRVLSIYALLAAAVLACAPSAISLARLWSNFDNPTYTHGFLLAAVFLWLVYRARHDLDKAPAQPSQLARVALLACALLWLIAWRASLQAVHEVLMVAMMGLTMPATFGWHVTRRMAVPLLLLGFALPGWEVLSPILQLLAAQVTGALLALAQVEHYVDGVLVYVPEGVFMVAGACSGINYLVAGLALAVMLGEVHQDSVRTRLGLVALMFVLALVTNWFRVFTIVYMGHLTKMQHPLIQSGHYTLGWAIFAGAALMFMWIASRLPVHRQHAADEARPRARSPLVPAMSIVLALLAVIPAGMWFASRADGDDAPSVRVTLPPGEQGWAGPRAASDSSWQPHFVGAHGSARASYSNPSGSEIEAFSVIYLTQRQGQELVGYENSLSGSQLTVGDDSGTVGSGREAFHEITVVDADGRRSLIWSVYTLGNRRLLSPLLVQIGYGAGSFTGQPRSGLTAFKARCGSTCEGARLQLERFARDMGGHFESLFAYQPKTGPEPERTSRRFVSLFGFRGRPS